MLKDCLLRDAEPSRDAANGASKSQADGEANPQAASALNVDLGVGIEASAATSLRSWVGVEALAGMLRI